MSLRDSRDEAESVARMAGMGKTHARSCPQYGFTYEVGSTAIIPRCECEEIASRLSTRIRSLVGRDSARHVRAFLHPENAGGPVVRELVHFQLLPTGEWTTYRADPNLPITHDGTVLRSGGKIVWERFTPVPPELLPPVVTANVEKVG